MLDVATETGEGPRMKSVEMCACPPGFAGTSCEVGQTYRVSRVCTYIHTYMRVIYSGLMSLRTAKPLDARGKKCLVGTEGKLKKINL